MTVKNKNKTEIDSKKEKPSAAGKREESVAEKLRAYSDLSVLPMHMPGHKRKKFDFLNLADVSSDITEIDGFDNLHNPKGILKESMSRAADLYGAEFARYLVGGSTVGVLSAIGAVSKRGSKVLVARNCHKSVYNAIELFGLKPIYLIPQTVPEFGFYGSVNVDSVKKTLEENRDIKLVIITSPTYDGVVSDIAAIAETVHNLGAKLFVDGAHGAHLGLSAYFNKNAVTLGADVTVCSLHKTLPCFTQTAILLCSDASLKQSVDGMLNALETSSPSYIFLSAIDGLVGYLEKNACEIFANYYKRLFNFIKRCDKLRIIKIFSDIHTDKEEVFGYDISKIAVKDFSGTLTGIELQKLLREQYLIECEAANESYVLLMTSVADSEDSLDRVYDALESIDNFISDKAVAGKKFSSDGETAAVKLPKPGCYPWECDDVEKTPFRDAEGKIAAEYIWAYPPGSPIIVKGEVIDSEIMLKLMRDSESGVKIESSCSLYPDFVLTVLDK